MTTALRLEYTFFSWRYDFPEHIERALEDDYVINRQLYSEETLKYIQCAILVDPTISPDRLLRLIRGLQPTLASPPD